MTHLTESGALVRLRPGRYAINPHVGWTGDLVKRQEAARHVSPLLRPVEPAASIPDETTPTPR